MFYQHQEGQPNIGLEPSPFQHAVELRGIPKCVLWLCLNHSDLRSILFQHWLNHCWPCSFSSKASSPMFRCSYESLKLQLTSETSTSISSFLIQLFSKLLLASWQLWCVYRVLRYQHPLRLHPILSEWLWLVHSSSTHADSFPFDVWHVHGCVFQLEECRFHFQGGPRLLLIAQPQLATLEAFASDPTWLVNVSRWCRPSDQHHQCLAKSQGFLEESFYWVWRIDQTETPPHDAKLRSLALRW